MKAVRSCVLVITIGIGIAACSSDDPGHDRVLPTTTTTVSAADEQLVTDACENSWDALAPLTQVTNPNGSSRSMNGQERRGAVERCLVDVDNMTSAQRSTFLETWATPYSTEQDG